MKLLTNEVVGHTPAEGLHHFRAVLSGDGPGVLKCFYKSNDLKVGTISGRLEIHFMRRN